MSLLNFGLFLFLVLKKSYALDVSASYSNAAPQYLLEVIEPPCLNPEVDSCMNSTRQSFYCCGVKDQYCQCEAMKDMLIKCYSFCPHASKTHSGLLKHATDLVDELCYAVDHGLGHLRVWENDGLYQEGSVSYIDSSSSSSLSTESDTTIITTTSDVTTTNGPTPIPTTTTSSVTSTKSKTKSKPKKIVTITSTTTTTSTSISTSYGNTIYPTNFKKNTDTTKKNKKNDDKTDNHIVALVEPNKKKDTNHKHHNNASPIVLNAHLQPKDSAIIAKQIKTIHPTLKKPHEHHMQTIKNANNKLAHPTSIPHKHHYALSEGTTAYEHTRIKMSEVAGIALLIFIPLLFAL